MMMMMMMIMLMLMIMIIGCKTVHIRVYTSSCDSTMNICSPSGSQALACLCVYVCSHSSVVCVCLVYLVCLVCLVCDGISYLNRRCLRFRER
jgi:hypothetical protein